MTRDIEASSTDVNAMILKDPLVIEKASAKQKRNLAGQGMSV
jgi:hypothetical protein